MAESDRICPRCTRTYGADFDCCPEDGQRLMVLSRADDDRVGQVLEDRFTLVGVLGSGGMGAVYRAIQHSTEREVAIKILHASATRDPAAVRRFLREAKTTSRLEHPNIITIFDFGQTDQGELYLAMERLHGRSLREILDEEAEPLSVERVAAVVSQVCDALHAAHSAGVIHRDLKPENTFVVERQDLLQEVVKVIDFGVAQVRAVEGTETMTQQGTVFGTPSYMSPEQALGQEVDPRSDIYSLGVVIYELLCGAVPFERTSALSTIMAHVHEPPPPLRQLRPDIPEPVADVIDLTLSKEADDRPQTALALRSKLEAALEGQRPTPPAPRQAPPEKRSSRGALALAMGLGVTAILLAVALGTIGWSLLGTPEPPPPPVVTVDAEVEAGDAARASFPPRTPSARDHLRIGRSGLSTILASPLAPDLFQSALHRRPDGQTVPLLVTEAPSLDNGRVQPQKGGGVEVTWQLRPGLRWSDGEPLEAEDALFAYEVFPLTHFVDARAVGARTVVARWDDKVLTAVDDLPVLPRHALKEIFAKGGSAAVQRHRRHHPTPSTGPYRVTAFVADERLEAEANPHFPGPPPSIEQVTVFVGEPDELMLRFFANELDILVSNTVTLEQARAALRREPEAVHIRPSGNQVILQPNLEHPLLGQLAVRQAIVQAIDRERIASEVYGVAGRVSHGPFIGEGPPGTTRWAHDPEAARAALEAAGALGARLPLLHSDSVTGRAIAALVEADLEGAGLVIERRAMAMGDLLVAFRERDHRGLVQFVIRIGPDQPLLVHWNLPLSEGVYVRDLRHSAYTDWVATLVEREERALLPERRAQLRRQLEGAYAEGLPHIPLVFATERVLAHPALRGWDLGPTDRFGAAMADWYFTR